MTPDDAMPANQAAVLAAVAHIWRTEGRVTVRAVSGRLGLSPSTVHSHLWALRRAGLVSWDVAAAGTLHPTFAVADLTSVK